MPKLIKIEKCSDCPYCYDNGQDIYCSELERLNLTDVFSKDSFEEFPKGCPLDDAKE